MLWLIDILKSRPELALFLTLAIGYAVGKIQIGTFKVGAVTGVLITGVVVGQLNIVIDPTIKSVFFLFFLFTLGYNAGPQFFKGFKKEGLSQVIFTFLVCVIGLISTIVVAKLFSYHAGQASGLAAGALTQSAIIGVSQDAILNLPVEDTIKTQMINFVPVGYAVTYIFGTIGAAFVLSTFGPKILGVNLEEESNKLDHASRVAIEDELLKSCAGEVIYRVYKIDEKFIGQRVEQVEKQLSTEPIRLFIARIKRSNQILIPTADEIIQKEDRIAIVFKEKDLPNVYFAEIGTEVMDYQLTRLETESVAIYLKNVELNGKTVKHIDNDVLTRHVFISKIQRAGEEIAYDDHTIIQKHDVITLTGPKNEVEAMSSVIGKVDRKTDETDMIFVALGILLGSLIGIPTLMLGKIGISLSTSGGALIMGLIFGFLHSRRPTVGNIPKGTAWFLSNVGLAVFVAIVGISAGPGFISGLRESGMSFLLAGVIVTLIPTFSGILLGKYVFKFSAPVTLGATAGALTVTAALGAVCEKAKSNAPVLGYTIPYAVGNILLTIWGSLIILFFS